MQNFPEILFDHSSKLHRHATSSSDLRGRQCQEIDNMSSFTDVPKTTPWSAGNQMIKEGKGLAWKRSSSWVIIRLFTCTARSRYVTQTIPTHAAHRAVCVTQGEGGRCTLRKRMMRSIYWPRDLSCGEQRKAMKQSPRWTSNCMRLKTAVSFPLQKH